MCWRDSGGDAVGEPSAVAGWVDRDEFDASGRGEEAAEEAELNCEFRPCGRVVLSFLIQDASLCRRVDWVQSSRTVMERLENEWLFFLR